MMIDEVFAERISKSMGIEMSAVGRVLHAGDPCAIIVIKVPRADAYVPESLANSAAAFARAAAFEYYARGMQARHDPSLSTATFDCKSCGGRFVGKPSTKQGYCLAIVEDFRAQDREMLEDRIGPKFNVADRQEAAAATLREARKDTLEAEKRCREEVARDWPEPAKDMAPIPAPAQLIGGPFIRYCGDARCAESINLLSSEVRELRKRTSRFDGILRDSVIAAGEASEKRGRFIAMQTLEQVRAALREAKATLRDGAAYVDVDKQLWAAIQKVNLEIELRESEK